MAKICAKCVVDAAIYLLPLRVTVIDFIVVIFVIVVDDDVIVVLALSAAHSPSSYDAP